MSFHLSSGVADQKLSAKFRPDVYRSNKMSTRHRANVKGSLTYPLAPVAPCEIKSAIRLCPPDVFRKVRALVETKVSAIPPGANFTDQYRESAYAGSFDPQEA